MTKFFITSIILTFCASAAFALPKATADQTCRALELEMAQPFGSEFRSRLAKPGVIEHFVGQGPMMNVLNTAMEGLDQQAALRIRWPLATRFVVACTNLRSHGFAEDVTVGQAMDQAVINLGLDRAKPQWGVVELPGVDYENHTCLELVKAVEPLGSGVWMQPINDPVVIATRQVLARYDTTTPAAIEKSVVMRKTLILMSMDNPTLSCTDLLEQSAKNAGLRLK